MSIVHERVLPFSPTPALEATEAPGGGTDPVSIGRRVRHHRRAADLTLAQLADRVGLSTSALSLLENGRREPRVTTLTAIAAALGVDLGQLLEGGPPTRRAALEVRWIGDVRR